MMCIRLDKTLSCRLRLARWVRRRDLILNRRDVALLISTIIVLHRLWTNIADTSRGKSNWTGSRVDRCFVANGYRFIRWAMAIVDFSLRVQSNQWKALRTREKRDVATSAIRNDRIVPAFATTPISRANAAQALTTTGKKTATINSQWWWFNYMCVYSLHTSLP